MAVVSHGNNGCWSMKNAMQNNRQITYKNWLGVIGLGLIAFMGFLDVTIVSNALPPIQIALKTSNSQLQWLLNVVFLCMSATMAVFGALGDYLGKRLVLFVTAILFLIASLGAGLSQTIQQLIFFRILQGISIGSLPLTMALANHCVPTHLQARATAIFTAIAGSGMAFGPVIGGLLIHWFNWRWIFLINVPLVLIGIMITRLTVQEFKEKEQASNPFDWIGVLLLPISIGLLVFALLGAEVAGWLSLKTIILGFIATLVFVLFVFHEMQHKAPLFYLRAFKQNLFLIAILGCITQGAGTGIILFLNPIYLQFVQGRSVVASGLILFGISSMLLLFSPIAGWFTNRFGAKKGCILLIVLTAISFLIQCFFSTDTNATWIILAFILFGAGWCLANVSPTIATVNSIPPSKVGNAMGLLWTIFSFSSALGLASLGTIFRVASNYHQTASKISFLHGFHYVMLILFAWSLLMFCLASFVRI